ncbi:MAG TPA: hypothetical protein VNI20_03000 [Fimbriimonadaceae bacterium]|nr:hypothetical protein [Fimbriimonadaceae bacterium]
MLTAAICLLTVLPQTYTLAWRPKKNDTVVYEYYMQDKTVSVEAAVEYHVTKVGSDGGYTVRSKSLGAMIRTNGQEMRDERPNERTADFDARGRLVSYGDKPTAEQLRTVYLTRFVAPEGPVGPGETWKVDFKNDPAPPTTTEYTLASVTGGFAVVTFKSDEKTGDHPQSAQGSWWIDVSTGQPTKFEATVTNFMGREGSETTLRLTRRGR